MDEIRVEHIYLEDGRHAEKRVTDWTPKDDGDVRVTELHVEERRPKYLAKKIVEVRKPVVVERQVESIDEATGQVHERIVEAVNPTKLQVVEHIATDNSITAQGLKQEDCDCFVTKQDLHDAVITLASVLKGDNVNTVGAPEVKAQEVGVSSMQAVIEERIVSKDKKTGSVGNILWVVIAVEAAVLGYVLLLM